MHQQLANDLFTSAQPFIQTTFDALMALLLAWVTGLISHVKNKTVADILGRARDAAATAVSSVEQTFVANVGANGVPLDVSSLKQQAALASAKLHLGPWTIAALQKIVGPGNLDAMLVSAIEAEVAKMNSTQQPVAPAVTPAVVP